MLKKVEATWDQIQAVSQMNFNNCRQWIQVLGKEDNCLLKVFHDYLVPLAMAHQPDVIDKVHHIVAKQNLKLLNHLDMAIKVEDGVANREQDNRTEEGNN